MSKLSLTEFLISAVKSLVSISQKLNQILSLSQMIKHIRYRSNSRLVGELIKYY